MPKNLSATRVDAARSHYPSDFKFTEGVPYRQVIPTNSQVYWRKIKSFFSPSFLDYTIKSTFKRQHCNPPIWHDYHYHDFELTVELRSPCSENDLYGVDMVEAEKIINSITDVLPERINELKECPQGTTEQLCYYFAKLIKFSDRSWAGYGNFSCGVPS